MAEKEKEIEVLKRSIKEKVAKEIARVKDDITEKIIENFKASLEYVVDYNLAYVLAKEDVIKSIIKDPSFYVESLKADLLAFIEIKNLFWVLDFGTKEETETADVVVGVQIGLIGQSEMGFVGQ